MTSATLSVTFYSNPALNKVLGIVAGVFAFSGFVCAQNIPPDTDWHKVRAQQPATLHLKMTLVRDHFFQGEKIDATLEFSNDDVSTVYILLVGAGNPGAVFHATDEKGHDVMDPVKWTHDWFPPDLGGMVATNKLGRYNLTLPANENLRFDQPGVYTLYAAATVTQGANPFQSPASEHISLLSDPTVITITPITPEQEKQVIAEAISRISMVDSPSGLDAPTREGVDELKYLQTPAARAELIKLMTRPQLVEPAFWGLEAAPDPAAEAGHLLAAVQTGKLVLGPYGVTLYTYLKASSLMHGDPPIAPIDFSDQDTLNQWSEIREMEKQARQELTTAMLQATENQGPAHAEALWTAFDEVRSERSTLDDKDPDGGAARAAVAQHQLELSDATVARLLTYWSNFGSDDFLPLVRREVARRGDNPNALIALCSIRPDEARPLVLAEMERPDSLFFKGVYARQSLTSVPPMPLPQLDDLFRKKLADPNESLSSLMPLIDCFGSANLLDSVLELDRDNGRNPETKMELYLYWLRCDPKGAAADFERDFQAGDTGCWTFLSQKLDMSWTDLALPLVRVVLKSGDPRVAYFAAVLLRLHGDATDLDPVITALERFQGDKNYTKAVVGNDARSILADDRWHLTAEQKTRLEALAGS